MADTALTIITDALLDLGVLADEEVPTASQAAGALRKLNNMIDAWGLESLLLYGDQSYVLPFTAGKGVYTIGPGGDFNISRPNVISAAYTRDSYLPPTSTFDTPLMIYTDEQWQDSPLKGQTAAWPNWGIWFNYTYPLIQAYVNPIPATSQYQLVIWTTGVLGNLTLDQVIALPAGYKRALTSNLVIDLASSYEREPSASTVQIAQTSKANIKVQNFQLNTLSVPGMGGQYDIVSNRIYVRT